MSDHASYRKIQKVYKLHIVIFIYKKEADMRKFFVIGALVLSFLAGPGLRAYGQEGVAPGTVAAIAKKSSASDFQNWIFALSAMVSVTAGILLVSWEPGAKAHH